MFCTKMSWLGLRGFYFCLFVCFNFLAHFQFPSQGIEPCPLQWKCGVLTTGLPEKSQEEFVHRIESSSFSSTDDLGLSNIFVKGT